MTLSLDSIVESNVIFWSIFSIVIIFFYLDDLLYNSRTKYCLESHSEIKFVVKFELSWERVNQLDSISN